MKKKEKEVRGFVFNKFEEPEKSVFDRLFDIFKEIITHTSGDLDEALDWLRQLDDEYQLTTDDYSIDDFVEELKQKYGDVPRISECLEAMAQDIAEHLSKTYGTRAFEVLSERYVKEVSAG